MTPHPNLVQTYGVCADSEYPYIVLEYCEGGSLDKVIFNNVCNTKEQRALVLGIAYGLTHLHRHNIVHRDLAARNILVCMSNNNDPTDVFEISSKKASRKFL